MNAKYKGYSFELSENVIRTKVLLLRHVYASLIGVGDYEKMNIVNLHTY